MKEIIYIQAGTLANYTGTHFWNTEQTYFTYGNDAPEPLTTHDISFRAGTDHAGGATYCPRALVLDRKSRFRRLARETVLVDVEGEGDGSVWSGEVSEYRQSEDDTHDPGCWVSNTDAAGWEEGTNWDEGKQAFNRYDEEHDLMDGSLRQFLEECDSPQGVQLMNDTEDFGPFAHALLVTLRDEHPKLPCLAFSFLSIPTAQQVDIDDYQGTRRMINDALYLRGLSELSTTNVPIQPPAVWPQGGWGSADQVKECTLFQDSPYLSSIIASALIETATLPLRLTGTQETIASFCSQLNVYGPPLAQLSGILPVRSPADLSGPCPTFLSRRRERTPYSTHGGMSREVSPPRSSRLMRSGVPNPTPKRHIYRVSASHPFFPIFPDADLGAAALLASMSTSSRVRGCLASYARFTEGCCARGAGSMAGLGTDELRELASDLWGMHDSVDCGEDEGSSGSGGPSSVGEDEE
ncbi:Misato segment II tubulin-like domain-containing protein [Infundibulicybe gibba]|nr:Misato segment II tubulin-like domain-containing protein [Infundibulicybe gibba]